MMQDFRMETFLAVCRFLNYTKAAQALNLTQPAVSQHIRYLEQAYKARLFDHDGKKIQLTQAGEILRSAALTIKHDEMHMRGKMQQANGGKENYAFGATLSAAEFMLPPDLQRFIKRHPHSRIQMHTANTAQLLQKLDAGELDFAIVEGDFPREEYDYFLYRNEAYVAVGDEAAAKRYAGQGLEALFGERLILREQGSGTREILTKLFRSRGIRLLQFANIMELGNIGAIKEMVKAGLGITFLYQAAIKNEPQLHIIPLQDAPLAHEIMFVFRKNSIFKEDYRRIFEELTRE